MITIKLVQHAIFVTMKKSPNISIYFDDTGGGHRSAAFAVKAGIEAATALSSSALSAPFQSTRIFCQPIIEKSHPVMRGLVDFYNYLARHHTTWIKYYYMVAHILKPESRAYFGLYKAYLSDLVRSQEPALIVSMHPMLASGLTQTVKDLGLSGKVKCAVVITDPNEKLWRAWGCKRADLIIAPNDIVRDKLLTWGIEEAKIRVLGMPVHPQFLQPPAMNRDDYLSQLGLNPDRFTVCLNAGWAGNSHLLETYAALAKCKRSLQVVFLTGYNKELEKQALAAARKTGIKTAVMPFSDQMSSLMAAVDVMISKAGGLTVYESLARRLPLVFDHTIEPMPQEASTMKMLIGAGVAQRLDKPEEITDIVDGIGILSDRKAPLPEDYQFNLTDQAINDIANTLLGMIDWEEAESGEENPLREAA